MYQILHIEALPNRTEDDEDSLRLLRMSLKTQQKGRLNVVEGLLYLLRLAEFINDIRLRYADDITFTKHPKKLNLLAISNNIYQITYRYLRNKWSAIINLKTSTNILGDGENFMGNARSYSHVWLRGLRYGSAIAHRGKSARYAYINGRQPVEIQYLLQVSHDRRVADTAPLIADLAIVRRFISDDNIPEFPWALW
jgi:hypothetical protein